MLNNLEGKVCRLEKLLYGLKQAGRRWYSKLDDMLKRCGATPTQARLCLYWINRNKDVTLIAIYVDDVLIFSKDTKTVEGIVRTMSKEFELKELGEAQSCVGIEFNIKDEEISLLQKGYIKDVLERFGMIDCKPVSTPLNLNDRVMKSTREPTEEESKQLYRELVGALTYLFLFARPDISFAVSYQAQFNDCHRIDTGIVNSDKLDLRGYVDDWGNSEPPYPGKSKKQQTVAPSTTEAMYMGLTEVAKEAIYLRRFLIELGVERLADVKVYNDNLSVVRLAENTSYHARSKQIDIRHHFVRNVLKSGQLELLHVGTSDMIAPTY
ncbi:hypothetical protein Trydic_g16907 [Trypoxylus dichotomus]